MPAARRSPTRTGAGPGRGTRGPGNRHSRPGSARSGGTRSGSAGRDEPSSATAATAATAAGPPVEPTTSDPQSVAESRKLDAVRRRSSLTTRAIALAVVLLVLTISYASSLRIYLSQRHEIASTKAEIALRQTQIDSLQSELNRWNDPNYVKTQARARLGWVVPGEVGYRVIGPDGKPVGAQTTGASSAALTPTPAKAWWQNLWGSVEAADAKPDSTPRPSKQPTITENSKPKG